MERQEIAKRIKELELEIRSNSTKLVRITTDKNAAYRKFVTTNDPIAHRDWKKNIAVIYDMQTTNRELRNKVHQLRIQLINAK